MRSLGVFASKMLVKASALPGLQLMASTPFWKVWAACVRMHFGVMNVCITFCAMLKKSKHLGLYNIFFVK